jgi:predicted amidohydrolase
MIISEKETYPVRYEDILIFPEYFMEYKNQLHLYNKLRKYKEDDINFYVVGVGNTYDFEHTTVLLLNKSLDIIGVRNKISIFWQEKTLPSLQLQAFNIYKDRRIGIVICKEVLHTAIAEIYRMMGVNILAVTIGGGQFWDLQRHSWIDQMTLFSDICQAPLICTCGATKEEGGINLIIKR